MLEALAYACALIAIVEAILLIWCVIIIDGHRGYSREYIRLVGKIRAETAVNAELARRAEKISHG
jgi:hypothetical protein